MELTGIHIKSRSRKMETEFWTIFCKIRAGWAQTRSNRKGIIWNSPHLPCLIFYLLSGIVFALFSYAPDDMITNIKLHPPVTLVLTCWLRALIATTATETHTRWTRIPSTLPTDDAPHLPNPPTFQHVLLPWFITEWCQMFGSLGHYFHSSDLSF